ncbi:TolC family protein [Pasteurella atlantica]|uniref:TolC family protein n=1 Tax=Pasteurellaceae TaxID=712 RepID=UPI002752400F|nr:TolC family protein [Pasteurella atlantica]MDP8033836.1 TolC family protein [Pasteurella atlantica]MDP8035771.1 TolC family protein [Pasteurella atlantica]MDP8037694.1 TolC family protein [Pasteurella atlantica]MDP8048072.1 TolC family protein [Pasteurella atlantica]MDP8050095.1 TolC family protein [Pasteurella atlantica]
MSIKNKVYGKTNKVLTLLSSGICIFALSSCSLPQKNSAAFTVRKLSFSSSDSSKVVTKNKAKSNEQHNKAKDKQDNKQVNKQESKQDIAQLVSTMNAVTKIKPAIPTTIKDNPLMAIVRTALRYNLAHSPLPSVIEQREFETEAIRLSRLPDIRPSASVSKDGNTFAGLSGSYTLYDFGLNNAREKQGELNTTRSRLDFSQEQRDTIADTLVSVSKIASLKAKEKLVKESISQQKQLANYAKNRLSAGLVTQSEPLALNLRLSELQTKLGAVQAEIQLNLKLLASKLGEPISIHKIPNINSLGKMASIFNTSGDAIALRQAEVEVQTAKEKLTQTEAERYPKVILEGRTGYDSINKKSYQANVTLSTPTSLFSSGTNVSVAEANYRNKQKRLSQLRLRLKTEYERIILEANRLKQNKLQLQVLEKDSQRSLALYRQKIDIAKASISDMISAYRTLLNTQEQLVNLENELLILKAKLIKMTEGDKLMNNQLKPSKLL